MIKRNPQKNISDIRRMYGPALKIIIGGPLAFVKTICFAKLKLMDRQQTLERQFYLLIP